MVEIDLCGKTAIVTGASQGLGAATARVLHRAGANVIVNYFPDPDGTNQRLANRVASELGSRSDVLAADVRSLSQVAEMMDGALARFGSIDILINNAGIVRDKTINKMSEEEWQAVVDTNLTGVFHTCKIAADRMHDEGHIVNLASISGVIGLFGQVNYAATKAGVIGMTKVLSRELAKRGITVNAVAPGLVLTEMGKTIPEASQMQMLAQIPLNRFGQPDDIAHAILFLCSPLASYMTGQTLHVNGGWWG